MTIRCLMLLFLLLQLHAKGQVHAVKLLNGDTTICVGSTVRLQTSFSLGSFRYFATYGGKDYFMDTVSRSWTAAKAAAAENGLDLWVVDNLAENTAVYDKVPYKNQLNSYFWIGLFQNPALESTGANSGLVMGGREVIEYNVSVLVHQRAGQ